MIAKDRGVIGEQRQRLKAQQLAIAGIGGMLEALDGGEMIRGCPNQRHTACYQSSGHYNAKPPSTKIV